MEIKFDENDTWTKTPYELKYEYGFFWLVIIFILLISILSFDKYKSTNEIFNLIISILGFIFFMLFLHRRFISKTAIILSEKGIKIFPLIKKPHFVSWNEIDKIYIIAKGHTYYIVKTIHFSYKDKSKNTFFNTNRLPVYAYIQTNYKRLKLLHEKYEK